MFILFFSFSMFAKWFTTLPSSFQGFPQIYGIWVLLRSFICYQWHEVTGCLVVVDWRTSACSGGGCGGDTWCLCYSGWGDGALSKLTWQLPEMFCMQILVTRTAFIPGPMPANTSPTFTARPHASQHLPHIHSQAHASQHLPHIHSQASCQPTPPPHP